MRAWPRVVSLSLGVIPVAALLGLTLILLLKSIQSVNHVGIGELLGNQFSSQYGSGLNVYGLLPAIWGTVLVSVIAVGLALPVAMAMALISSEFSLGIFGRGMRVLLGALSGIPSIVYALAAVIFVKSFMIPKFAADSTFSTFDPAKIGATVWPQSDVPFNAGAFPWDPTGLNNSTLLAGVLIAMLIVPFLAPMIEDAIRSVPQAPREASLALGVTRWTSFRRVVLPYAAPGIVSATALALLKALGDTMIVVFVIGFESESAAKPLFDVFERDAPLTAVGSGLLGGFQGIGGCTAARCDTGYFSAFLLLIIALAIVVASFVAQNRLRRRYAR